MPASLQSTVFLSVVISFCVQIFSKGKPLLLPLKQASATSMPASGTDRRFLVYPVYFHLPAPCSRLCRCPLNHRSEPVLLFPQSHLLQAALSLQSRLLQAALSLQSRLLQAAPSIQSRLLQAVPSLLFRLFPAVPVPGKRYSDLLPGFQ